MNKYLKLAVALVAIAVLWRINGAPAELEPQPRIVKHRG